MSVSIATKIMSRYLCSYHSISEVKLIKIKSKSLDSTITSFRFKINMPRKILTIGMISPESSKKLLLTSQLALEVMNRCWIKIKKSVEKLEKELKLILLLSNLNGKCLR